MAGRHRPGRGALLVRLRPGPRVSTTSVRSALQGSLRPARDHEGIDGHAALRRGDQRVDVHRVEVLAEVRRQHGESGDGARDRVHVGRRVRPEHRRATAGLGAGRSTRARSAHPTAAARAAGRGGPPRGRRRPRPARAARTAGRGRCRARAPRRERPSAARPPGDRGARRCPRKPHATRPRSARPSATPPTSDLCRTPGATVFIATGQPTSSAAATAPSAEARRDACAVTGRRSRPAAPAPRPR